MHEAVNANSFGTPGSTSFARSSLLYWVFTGLVFMFTYVVCLVIYDIDYRQWNCLLVLLLLLRRICRNPLSFSPLDGTKVLHMIKHQYLNPFLPVLSLVLGRVAMRKACGVSDIWQEKLAIKCVAFTGE